MGDGGAVGGSGEPSADRVSDGDRPDPAPGRVERPAAIPAMTDSAGSAGPARALLARAGFTVSEGGTDIMDAPVLVYIGRPSKGWPTFEIFNHGDRLLGRTRSLGKPRRFALNGATSIDNPLGVSMMEVQAKPKLFRVVYEVTGAATATIRMGTVGSQSMTLEANHEPYGFVVGSDSGVIQTDLTVLDHHRDEVGTIRSFVESAGPLGLSISHVLSFSPGLGGELRRLLVAVPIVIEGVRRNHAATAMRRRLE